MPIEITGCLKGKKGCNSDAHIAQLFIPNVEIIMRKPAACFLYYAIIRILGGILRFYRTKRIALFHALENEIDPKAILPFHCPEVRANILILANAVFRPFPWYPMILCKYFNA